MTPRSFPARVLCLTALALGVAVSISAGTRSARADDPALEPFRRAEIEENVRGNLSRAAEFYRDAADRALDGETRALSSLRRASCLRRLARPETLEDARAILTTLAALDSGASDAVRRAATDELTALRAADAATVPDSVGTSPDNVATPPAPPVAELGRLERELSETRDALEQALSRATEFETKHALLAQEYRRREAELAKRRAADAGPEPATAEEALERARKRREVEREDGVRNARTHLAIARLLYRAGSFTEARRSLYEAEASDPENADVRALLATLSAPLGEREALFEEILKVAALAREVRASHAAAEVSRLTDEARRRQGRSDFVGSVTLLEQALSQLDAAGDLIRGRSRADVLSLLRNAADHGAPRTTRGASSGGGAADPSGLGGTAADEDERRWAAALRGLLEEGGAAVTPGLSLRFHDAGPVLAATALPPVPTSSVDGGWTLSATDVPGAPLLAAFVRAEEARAFVGAGTALRVVGTTLVALADTATQRRIADRFSALRIASPSALDLRAVAFRADAGAVTASLLRRGIAASAAEGGGRVATLAAEDVEWLMSELSVARETTLGDLSLRATPLRPFRLWSGTASAWITADLIPMGGLRSGVGLRVTTTVTRAGQPDAAPLSATVTAGGALGAGDALLLFAVPDPQRPTADVAVLVRLGNAGGSVVRNGGTAPSGPRADNSLPPAAAQVEIPESAAADDSFAPPLSVPDHPLTTRRDAILRRLRDSTRDAKLVDVRRDRIVIVASESALAAVRAFVARLAATPTTPSFEVRLFQVTQEIERELIAERVRLSPAQGNAFSYEVLKSDGERRAVEARLRLSKGEISLLDPIVKSLPTVRSDVARIVRTTVPGADSLPGWADEGLVLGLRPLDRGADGRLALDLSARAVWFAPGPAGVKRASYWWGDLQTTLARGESLLLIGARSPLAAASDVDRLVVLIRPVE